MRIKIWSLLILSGFCCLLDMGQGLSLKAQTSIHTITGSVVDTQGEAIIGAHVQLKNRDRNFGATTATDGSFAIKNIGAGKYRLSISYIGYTTIEKELDLSKTNDWKLGRIELKEETHTLQTLTVTALASDMQVRGDTLEFSAANYGMNEGSMLEDLIKKLPGAEIDESGKIKINGKEISKILIDGKEFFAGDPKVAGKNLPTNMIDKVQVLERLSDMARMSGFDDGEEESVINLTTKRELRSGTFGSAYGGYGTTNRYEVGTIINRLGEKSQLTVIASANNSNNQSFTDLDIDMEQSSFINQDARAREKRLGLASPEQIPTIDPDAGVTESAIAGINTSLDLNPFVNINGNGQYGYADQLVTTQKTTTNILPQGNTHQTDKSIDRSFRHNAGTDFRVVWKPDSITELVYTPSLKMNVGRRLYEGEYQTVRQDEESLINKGQFGMTADSRAWLTSHNMHFSRRLNNRGRTLSSMLRLSLSGEEKKALHYSDRSDQTRYDNNDISGLRYSLRLSWVEPLAGNFFTQGIFGLRGERRENDRDWQQFADPNIGSQIQEKQGLFKNNFVTQTIGINLKYIQKNSDFTLGFSLNPSQTHNKRESSASAFGIDTMINTLNFAPVLSYTYNPKRQTSVRIGYRGRTVQPQLSQLVPMPDDTNPLLEVIGNPQLKPAFTHSVFGRVQLSNSQRRASLHASLFASYTMNAIISDSKYDSSTGKRTLSYVNGSGSSMIRGNLSYTSSIITKGMSLRASLGGRYSSIPSYINGQKNISQSLENRNRLSLVYQSSLLYTSLNGKLLWNRIANTTLTKNVVNTQQYMIGYELTFNLPFGLSISSDIQYNTNAGFSENYQNRALNWDAFVSYSFLKDNRATIRLKGYDMLDQGKAVRTVNTPLTVSEEWTNALGRSFMLHFLYKFDTFGANKRPGKARDLTVSPKHNYE